MGFNNNYGIVIYTNYFPMKTAQGLTQRGALKRATAASLLGAPGGSDHRPFKCQKNGAI